METKTAEQIESQLKTIETALEGKMKGIAGEEAKAISESIKGQLSALESKSASFEKMESDLATTIEAIDQMQIRMKDSKMGEETKLKSLPQAIGEALALDENKKEIDRAMKSVKGSFIIPLKNVDLSLKTTLTVGNFYTAGDPVATYNQRQAILPSQKINFRDLIPTASSPTGLYVTYRENTGETNNIAKQTEGASKAVNDYAMTEVKTVNNYIAGTTTFSKQLLKSAPWMQSTLTRMLLRDFYKAENAYFYSTVTGAATGVQATGTSPDDIKQLIAQIGAILDSNFNASYIVVSHALLGRLIANTYTQGYYPGAGQVNLTSTGLQLWGVPVIGASWATANMALIFDADYLERVEVEGLNLAFSFEEGNNFTKNLVTARVECFEEINLMLAESAYYINLGAS